MAEVGECDLVVAGNVKTKPSESHVSAGLSEAIKRQPVISLPDLMDDFARCYADLEGAETFLVVLVGDLSLFALLAILHDRAIKVVVIHLEQDVVVDVGTVEHPLQAMTFG